MYENKYGKYEILLNDRFDKKVKVKFTETGFEYYTELHNAKLGLVKDYLKPNYYGVGFLGSENASPCIGGVRSKENTHWIQMLRRCYENKENRTKEYMPYIDCSVDERWFNFLNFKEWCNHQKGFTFPDSQLDKDLLVKGNKVYKPEICLFLPRKVNNLFKRTDTKGFTKYRKKFQSHCADFNGKILFIQTEDKEECREWYKATKKSVIMEYAEFYKNDIDIRAYHAMMNYEVTLKPE